MVNTVYEYKDNKNKNKKLNIETIEHEDNTNTIQGSPSLLECMIKYVNYMNRSFEERMLENVDMIITNIGPKIKKNNKDMIRYDIQNFMPLEYKQFIYLFHNKNIIEKRPLFNIVYKIIKWKSMLENDINLKLLSNEDEGDELIEEENNEILQHLYNIFTEISYEHGIEVIENNKSFNYFLQMMYRNSTKEIAYIE